MFYHVKTDKQAEKAFYKRGLRLVESLNDGLKKADHYEKQENLINKPYKNSLKLRIRQIKRIKDACLSRKAYKIAKKEYNFLKNELKKKRFKTN